MEAAETQNQTVVINGLSDREFLERYAGLGRVGLSGGVTPIDLAISRAERHLDGEKRWGIWTHAFLFEGVRADGHHWVMDRTWNCTGNTSGWARRKTASRNTTTKNSTPHWPCWISA